MSQQALSYGIRCLEKTAGRPLFNRGRLGVELTQFGSVVYGQAVQVPAGVDAIAQTFETRRSGFEGSISMGVHPLCFQRNGGTLTGDILLQFSAAYPSVEFLFNETDNDSIQEAVLNGAMDFGVGIAPSEGVETRLLYRFPMAAVILASDDWAFLADEASVTLGQLHREVVPGVQAPVRAAAPALPARSPAVRRISARLPSLLLFACRSGTNWVHWWHLKKSASRR